jgi:hypothetical protein
MGKKIWKVQLKPFTLAGKGKKVFVAQVVNANVVLGIDHIADSIKDDGYELNKATIIDVHQRINQKVAQALQEGNSVDLGIVKAAPVVTGPWEDHDSFQDGVHTKSVSVTPKALLLKTLNEVAVNVVGYRKTGDASIILGVVDKATKRKDYHITVGDNIIIKGSKIKLQGLTQNEHEEDDEDNVQHEDGIGVFFVTEKGQNIQADRIDKNTVAEVEVRIPNTLLKGKNYGLHIVTRYTGGQPLNVPRTIVADFLLTTIDEDNNKTKQK